VKSNTISNNPIVTIAKFKAAINITYLFGKFHLIAMKVIPKVIFATKSNANRNKVSNGPKTGIFSIKSSTDVTKLSPAVDIVSPLVSSILRCEVSRFES